MPLGVINLFQIGVICEADTLAERRMSASGALVPLRLAPPVAHAPALFKGRRDTWMAHVPGWG